MWNYPILHAGGSVESTLSNSSTMQTPPGGSGFVNPYKLCFCKPFTRPYPLTKVLKCFRQSYRDTECLQNCITFRERESERQEKNMNSVEIVEVKGFGFFSGLCVCCCVQIPHIQSFYIAVIRSGGRSSVPLFMLVRQLQTSTEKSLGDECSSQYYLSCVVFSRFRSPSLQNVLGNVK